MKQTDIAKQLEKLWISSIRVYSHHCKPKENWRKRWLHTYALCRVTEGDFELASNGTVYSLRKGDWCVLPSGTIVEGRTQSEHPAELTLILFTGAQLGKQAGAWRVSQPGLPMEGKLKAGTDTPAVGALCEQLVQTYESRQANFGITLKFTLSKLLSALLATGEADGGQRGSSNGLEPAIAYMDKFYMHNLSIRQLAGLAGFSLNHFTRMFKQQLDRTPSEYLQELRMAKAKQLLLSRQRIKEVAKQVGFRDEHYFSRAFKKTQGVAPTMYFKRNCHRVGALYYGLDEHLATLGLQPVAFLSYAERVYGGGGCGESDSGASSDCMRLSSVAPNYEKLLRIKPDLLLTSDRLDRDETFGLIAPTATIAHSNSGGRMLEQIAAILGRERQASEWLERYGEQRERLSKSIHNHWGRANAYFIRVSAGYYRVYGSRNQTGTLLYEDLGLSVPSLRMAGEWAKNISLQDVPDYNADHIFLMCDPTHEASWRLKELLGSEQWAALDAVKANRVHAAGDLMFKALGSASRLRAMERIADQLGVRR